MVRALLFLAATCLFWAETRVTLFSMPLFRCLGLCCRVSAWYAKRAQALIDEGEAIVAQK